MTTAAELPTEAVEYGATNGFALVKMAAGERVRWSPGVTVAH